MVNEIASQIAVSNKLFFYPYLSRNSTTFPVFSIKLTLERWEDKIFPVIA
jgi:hypothetical protein